jgi:starch phosphorylase
MKNSIEALTPRFNTNKMVRDYARRFYCPAAVRYEYLKAEAVSGAKALSKWKSNVRKAWPELAIKAVKAEGGNGQGYVELNPKQRQLELGSKLGVKALVRLGGLSPDDVSVELYHGSLDARGSIRHGSVVRNLSPEWRALVCWFDDLQTDRSAWIRSESLAATR